VLGDLRWRNAELYRELFGVELDRPALLNDPAEQVVVCENGSRAEDRGVTKLDVLECRRGSRVD